MPIDARPEAEEIAATTIPAKTARIRPGVAEPEGPIIRAGAKAVLVAIMPLVDRPMVQVRAVGSGPTRHLTAVSGTPMAAIAEMA